jgi:uncharacterized protein (TIGR00299 family) protein
LSRTAYIDLVGGLSGDMLLAALLDAGGKEETVRHAWSQVGLAGVELETSESHPAGLRALRAEVLIHGHPSDSHFTDHPDHAHQNDDDHAHAHANVLALAPAHDKHHHAHRPYRVIRERLEASSLSPRTKQLALEAFRLLAEAEGRVHGVAADDVELHEVGSDDAIADIVGVCSLVEAHGLEDIVASPIPLARGLVHGAHGPIPLPGPATLELLRGAPIVGVDLVGETITPTGAALLRALTGRFGPAPAMTLEGIGVGAGRRSWPDRPNIVRVLIGPSASHQRKDDEDAIVEANIDDMSPEHVPALERALFGAGAIDVWSQPIAMKKGRPGTLVCALARAGTTVLIADTFFTHSTTLGVRIHPVSRIRSERRMAEVETAYGKVRIKIADRPLGPPLVAPEHEDCARLAEAAGVPLRAVTEAALFAAWSSLVRHR